MRILGVDPGPHVGISEWTDGVCTRSYETTPARLAFELIKTPFIYRYEVVCAENYVPQGGFGNAGPGIETLKILGLLEWYGRECGRDFRLTSRGDRAGALTRLKAVGYAFHDEPKSDHARDAEAVVVAAMRWSVRDVLAANQ